MKKLKYTIIAILLAYGCSENEQVRHENAVKEKPSVEQLNISILIDLSDRIRENKTKDQELVRFIAEYFKAHIEKKNLFFIRDKIKVLFYPELKNDKINSIAEALNIKLDPSDREKIKETWENITINYSEQISVLYNIAEKEGESNGYPGSDIWRFFGDKVSDFCVDPDTAYRNVLIILTDGYLYHKDSQLKEKNRTSYLTAPFVQKENLRNNSAWETKFQKGDYGFITKRNDLNNLEVLILEINPSQLNKEDEEIIKRYWSKWFDEMNVSKYKIYSTDLPTNTKELIRMFLNDN